MNNKSDVYELYQKAMGAYEAIPKELMKRTLDEFLILTFSCPHCGVIFARIPVESNSFRFNEPIFCCGKLMI